jgi:ubiquinone/menaquinone biosynthesis C-methylase UbiE
VRDRLFPWVLSGLEPGDDVLEVGPGPGVTTDLLRSWAPRLTAIEIDPDLGDRLRRRTAGTNVEVITGDATSMPFPDRRFSAATSFTMLHHVPSTALQDRLLREVYRVLRPGAVFAGCDSTSSLVFRLAHLFDTMVLVDPDGFAGRLQAAGFVDVQVERANSAFRFRATRPGSR